MMMKIPFGITEAALLFALGFGYIICLLARKEDKDLKQLGHVIGMSIIVLSSALILLSLYVRFKNYSQGMGCVTMKSGMMMPAKK